MIKIGPSRGRESTWEGQFSLKCTSAFEVLGIVFDSKDTINIRDLKK